MAHPVRLLSSLLAVAGLGCHTSSPDLPVVVNPSSMPVQHHGSMYEGDSLAHGIYIQLSGLGDTLTYLTCVEGKKDGLAKVFHPNGQLKEERYYTNGEKDGIHTGYWYNGTMAWQYEFNRGVNVRTHRTWSLYGVLTSEHHYDAKGQEDGVQRVWYDNGRIKSNYVVKDGRRFGLLGTKNCVNVRDSLSF